MTPNEPRLTRSEQREAARAKAKALREQHKKGEKRKRVLLQVGIAVVLVGAVGAVVFALFNAGNGSTNVATPTNATFNDGVKVGADLQLYTPTFTPAPAEPVADPTEIIIYVDYQCPICALFEIPNSDQIKEWVATGAATLQVHTLSFLDGRGSPNQFSSRAANAAMCIAEYSPNNFYNYSTRLFQAQPTEGQPGPENPALIEFANEVGASNIEKVTSCINNNDFGNWIKDATDKALTEPIPGTSAPVSGTPTILVNGQQYTWNTGEELQSAARFAQFVQFVTSGGTQ
ncbi:MAG: DsbA family protein [Actinomycetota bacterium]